MAGNGKTEVAKTEQAGVPGVDAEIKAKEAFLDTSSFEKAFKTQDVLNAIRLIILQDENFIDNAMRYNIPNRRFAVAAASYYRKCLKHGYTEGIEQLKMQLGLMTAIGEKRMLLLVEAVIGERKFKDNGQGVSGLADQIKNWAFNKK